MLNPIVIFIFFFSMAGSIISVNSWFGLVIFAFAEILLLVLNHKQSTNVFKHARPFLYFLPIFILFYIFISIVFSDLSWRQILSTAGMTISRLLLLILIMSLYIEISKNNNLILALRSLWSKFNLKWRWVDDLFMFLELTLRFYPSFQLEWNTINRSRKALGLEQYNSKWDKVKSIANDIPGIIVQNYLKAENTAGVMKQRGYGNIVPRGVANPISFRLIDLIATIIILCSFGLLHNYVSL